MADSEVTTAQIAEILTTHKVGKSDMDCDEGCCWQHYCTCGALIYPTLEDHIAAVLLASFELVPKGRPLTRQDARELYDRKLREMYPDDAVLLARLDEIHAEENRSD